MSDQGAIFAAAGLALYAGHHVGDYWVQRDEDAQHKGDAGSAGVLHCLLHVLTYMATQTACLFLTVAVLQLPLSVLGAVLGLALSGGTHYLADRREHGIMFKLARRIPGKADFLKLGVPRGPQDNPSLGTGAWALDQAWHILFGVFGAALVIAGLS